MDEKFWLLIEQRVSSLVFGNIILTFQDGRAIQLEVQEKIRLTDDWQKKTSNKMVKQPPIIWQKVISLATGLSYGQINIQVRNGLAVQTERLDKHRLTDYVGVGEAI